MSYIIATQLEAKTIGRSSTEVDDPNLCVTKSKAINSFNCNIINADTYADNQLVCKKDLVSNNVTIEYYDTSDPVTPLFTQIVSPTEFKLPTTTEILQLLKNNNITSVCNTELYNWANEKNTEEALSFFAFVQYKDKSIYDSNGSNVYYTSGDTPNSIQTGTQKYIVTIQPYIEIFVGNSDQFISLNWEYTLQSDSTLTGSITCLIKAKRTTQSDAFSTITVKKNSVIIRDTNGTQSTQTPNFFDIYANTFINGVSYTPNENFYLALGKLDQDPITVKYNNCAASEFNSSGSSSPGCIARFKNIYNTQSSVTWKICGAHKDYNTRILEFEVILHK